MPVQADWVVEQSHVWDVESSRPDCAAAAVDGMLPPDRSGGGDVPDGEGAEHLPVSWYSTWLTGCNRPLWQTVAAR